MSEPVVLYEEITIRYITLNRPEAMNSLTYESYDYWKTQLDNLKLGS